MVPITALYAALLVAIFVVLTARVGAQRRRVGASILDGGDMELALAMRKHGNFAEFVPLALVLMGLVEANGGNATFLHVTGIVLVLSRIAHPLGLRNDRASTPGRIAGAGGTVLMILALGVVALWQGVGGLA